MGLRAGAGSSDRPRADPSLGPPPRAQASARGRSEARAAARAVSALWVFVPVLGAPIVHAPILRSDLLPGLKRPLDGGLELRGRRVFGANKTLRGLLAMVGGVAPGTQRRSPAGALISIYDQGDFVPVVWLLLLPIWAM